MNCGVDCRHGSDLAWLWPWLRQEATAPTGPLAWEPPYAMGVALKIQIIIIIIIIYGGLGRKLNPGLKVCIP